MLERLARVDGSKISGRSVALSADQDSFRRDANVPTILKLHGSVNWRREGPSVISIAADDAALTCDPNQLALATPGPTKPEVIAEPPFDWLWGRAAGELADADAIVFVGYRFPPSDAVARERLLRAIRDNKSQHLDVHIVLGPERSKDVVRLERLVQHALESRERTEYEPGRLHGDQHARSFSIHWEPLWAEDYLSVFTREGLQALPRSGWNDPLPSLGR